MVNKIIGLFTTAFVITGLGIALRPGAPTASVIGTSLSGLAKIQTAAFGPTA